MILPRIRSRLPSLSDGDRRVAELILSDPRGTIQSSVSEVAQRGSVSHSSVTRFCQGLQLRGFADLKLALAQDLAVPLSWANSPVEPNDPASDVLKKVLRSCVTALEEVPATLDASVLAEAADAVARAGRVLVYGVSSSGRIAEDGAHRLVRVGVDARATQDAAFASLLATLLAEGDACIAISHSGETRDTVLVAHQARSSGATVVAITGFHRSPLTEVAHHSLVGGGRAGTYRMAPAMSNVVHIAILDTLVAYVASRSPDQSRDLVDRTASANMERQY
jgi:DNA-binding MurR/RpiR family transcriptional regulator